MNWIARLFVRAKHWQIFLLFVVAFAVGEFPGVGNLTASANSPEGSAVALLLTEVATVVAAWCFILWLWSLGAFLNSVVPPALRPSDRFFLFSISYGAIDVLLSIAVFQLIDPRWLLVVIPLLIMGLCCVFYGLYFVSKSLVMAETGERASFFNCLGPFLLLWFAIIGVWFIQPRVNRLYTEKRARESATEAAAI